ncbi:hypothetical protein CK203_020710 [Vitis vinifera]|uniref:Uncharacterized protein n=1 Tax=Vitis vinifera TaxID=29760 RepID=A0A438FMY6_VITVI|nr:hypothetical protein CK203_020710 [Vitis vinifera]
MTSIISRGGHALEDFDTDACRTEHGEDRSPAQSQLLDHHLFGGRSTSREEIDIVVVSHPIISYQASLTAPYLFILTISTVTHLFRRTISATPYFFRPTISPTPYLFRPIISTTPYLFRPTSITTSYLFRPTISAD